MDLRDSNLRLIQDFMKAVFAEGGGPLDAFIDSNIEVHEPESLPYGGVYKGAAGLNRIFTIVFKETWANPNYEIVEIVAGAERVVVVFQLTLTSRKTGRTISFPGAEVFRIRNGRIFEIRPIYWDTHAVLALYNE